MSNTKSKIVTVLKVIAILLILGFGTLMLKHINDPTLHQVVQEAETLLEKEVEESV